MLLLWVRWLYTLSPTPLHTPTHTHTATPHYPFKSEHLLLIDIFAENKIENKNSEKIMNNNYKKSCPIQMPTHTK